MHPSRVFTLATFVSLIARTASAEPEVRPVYLGATLGLQVGAQMAWEPLPAWGGDLFVGARVSRWVSIEGFVATRFTFDPLREPIEGAACSGTRTDWWRWQMGGARLWIHFIHTAGVDVATGPSIGAGVAVDRNENLSSSLLVCGGTLDVASGAAFSAGVPFALEVRPMPWLGLRFIVGPSIDFGLTGSHGFAALSLNAALGPVLRF